MVRHGGFAPPLAKHPLPFAEWGRLPLDPPARFRPEATFARSAVEGAQPLSEVRLLRPRPVSRA